MPAVLREQEVMDQPLVTDACGLVVARVDLGAAVVPAGHRTVRMADGWRVSGETHHDHEPDDAQHRETSIPRHS